MVQRSLSIAVLALLAACNAHKPAPDADTTPSANATTPTRPSPSASTHGPAASSIARPSPTTVPATTDTTPAFVDTVWRAGEGTGVEAGSTYTFRRDGALLMASPHGTPGTGRWRYEGGKLTMVEEGIPYPTDIVSQDATHLVLRSHNPGGVVEIALVADAAAPRPRP